MSMLSSGKLTVMDALVIGVEILKAALLALDNGGHSETPIDPASLKLNKSAEEVLSELKAKLGRK